MISIRSLACGAVLATLLVGCMKPDAHIQVGHDSVLGHITVDGDHLSVAFPDGGNAVINAGGDLAIAGKPVVLSAEQRGLTQRYYSSVLQLRAAALATGRAGAAMAGHAVSSVVEGLAHGNPDQIGTKIEAEAGKLEVQALALCQQVIQVQQTQVAIAAAVPAFTPYPIKNMTTPKSCH